MTSLVYAQSYEFEVEEETYKDTPEKYFLCSTKSLVDISPASPLNTMAEASCELGYVAVFSDGKVYCRADNVRIKGAKGEDAELNAVFEAVNIDDIGYAITKDLISLPYDDKISIISEGVTTIGVLGKCLMLPVTRKAFSLERATS